MDRHHEPEFHTEDRKAALALPLFAEKNQITEDRVWEMIEEGLVSARFVNDSILILRDADPAIDQNYQLPEIGLEGREVTRSEPVLDHAPALPESLSAKPELSAKAEAASRPNPPPPVREKIEAPAQVPPFVPLERTEEPKDFVDKSSAAPKLPDFDSSHDLILFAQDALSRTAELSHQLLATKDELLRMKDERIAWLSQLVQQKDREIRNLSRQLEDAAILDKFERPSRP